MPLRVEARDILDVAEICGLSDYPLWAGSDRRITDFDIATALTEGRLIAPDDSRDPNMPMSALDHAARVAWLVRFGDLSKTVVTIQGGTLADGNHRFAACLYAGVETLRCVFMEGPEAAIAEAA